MIVAFEDVAQERGRAIEIVDDDVDVAVVEQIAERGAARGDDIGKAGADDGGTSSNFLPSRLRNSCGRSAKVVPQSCWSTSG